MFCQVFCSCTMWSKLRKKVLKSRNYDCQNNPPLTNPDVHLEKFEKIRASPKKDNRRSTSGFTKCLIPHLASTPIGCACKQNVSPVETPIPGCDKTPDGKERTNRDNKKSIDEKKSTTKSNTPKGGGNTKDRSLNYYFKETDSCEIVRKNKPVGNTNKQQKGKVGDKLSVNTSQALAKKDVTVIKSASMKEKTQPIPIFSAGQREKIKSGIDLKDFQRVFQNSQESIADQNKTVTFGTFGKGLSEDEFKPPLFQLVKPKKLIDEPLDSSLCEQSILDGSLSSSSKGASLTSEEGVESGYGTQDDGNDRLARSISSNSDCNPTDFAVDLDKIKCRISRESTGEEDVFHHFTDHPSDKVDKLTMACKVLSNGANKLPAKITPQFRPSQGSKQPTNMNIVVAEVHAEHFDEPKPLLKKLSLAPQFTQKKVNNSPVRDDKQNNNTNKGVTGLTKRSFDINYNPHSKAKNNNAQRIVNLSKPKPVSSGHCNKPSDNSVKTSSQDHSPGSQMEEDSDEEDIREYLPADVNSMSEVFNSSATDGQSASGLPPLAELYASVPKTLDESFPPPPTAEEMQFTMIEPSVQIIKPEPFLTKKDTVTKVTKVNSRPDLIDFDDPEVEMQSRGDRNESPAPESSDLSEDDTIHQDYDEESHVDVTTSDDGDPGPPLPSRNYSQNGNTLSKGAHIVDMDKVQSEAPTLVIRKKSPDLSDSGESSQKSGSVSPSVNNPAIFDSLDEISHQEEPIHMTWEEVMKEAKSLGIPLNPPAASKTLDRRSSTSSQDSCSTPIASPIKLTTKVKRGHSESKKRSPFKEKFKLYNLFTLRKHKAENGTKTLPIDHGSSKSDKLYRRSISSPADSTNCVGTMPRDHMRVVKACGCGAPDTGTHRRSSPIHYTYYARRSPCVSCAPCAPYTSCPTHRQMNVSINVSLVSNNSDGQGSPGSPDISVMTQSLHDEIDCAGNHGNLMTRSMISQHSMSNQSLSQQSVMSGHSAHAALFSGQSGQSSVFSGQSAHSYHSAHSPSSIGSPTFIPRKSTPTRCHSTDNSPSNHPVVNGLNGNYGINGSMTLGHSGYYGSGFGGSSYGTTPREVSGGSNADFISSLLKLKDCGWYWGPLGWDDAESKLSNKPDGSFLVRDSSDDRYILSLSFRSQGTTHHTRIEHYKGMFSFYSQPKSHGAATIVEFIEKAMEHSRNGKFLYFLRPRAPGLPPAPVQLLFPVSRLQNMQSLQHMCRFVILKQVRKDHIDRLPIPPRLKEYLKQNQYYAEYLGGEALEMYPRY